MKTVVAIDEERWRIEVTIRQIAILFLWSLIAGLIIGFISVMATGVTIKEKGSISSLNKQVTYATAVSLTRTAQEAQTAVISDIEQTFTVRNNWDKPSNAMGIKVKPATKDDLSAEVRTRADWLIPHEEGEDKRPAGKFIAIPTSLVRRTKRDIIQRSQRPNALRGKGDIVLQTKRGPALFVRVGKGKRSRLKMLYLLRPKAHIKKQSTMLEPTVKIVEKRFGVIFGEQLEKAFQTAK